LFGTSDDLVISPSLEGAINSIAVKGTLDGSDDPTEHFGIVAPRALSPVMVGGRKLQPLQSLGNVTLLLSLNVLA